MKISVELKKVPVVKVEGEIDHFEAPNLKAEMARFVEQGERYLILDLSDVSYIDSGGVTVLFWAMHEMRPEGGKLALIVSGREVRSILDLVSIPQIPFFEMYSSLSEALASRS